MIDLDELRKKAEAATEGPWVWVPGMWSDGDWYEMVQSIDHTNVIFDDGSSAGEYSQQLKTDSPNAAFIAAANPSVVLELISRVERAEAVKEEAVNRHGVTIARCNDLDAENHRLRTLLDRVKEALTEPRKEPACRMLFNDIEDALVRRV